jgi:hypothetical protein
MAKGQQRSNREARKPKKDKKAAAPTTGSVTAQAVKANPWKQGAKKP